MRPLSAMKPMPATAITATVVAIVPSSVLSSHCTAATIAPDPDGLPKEEPYADRDASCGREVGRREAGTRAVLRSELHPIKRTIELNIRTTICKNIATDDDLRSLHVDPPERGHAAHSLNRVARFQSMSVCPAVAQHQPKSLDDEDSLSGSSEQEITPCEPQVAERRGANESENTLPGERTVRIDGAEVDQVAPVEIVNRVACASGR